MRLVLHLPIQNLPPPSLSSCSALGAGLCGPQRAPWPSGSSRGFGQWEAPVGDGRGERGGGIYSSAPSLPGCLRPPVPQLKVTAYLYTALSWDPVTPPSPHPTGLGWQQGPQPPPPIASCGAVSLFGFSKACPTLLSLVPLLKSSQLLITQFDTCANIY